MCPYDKISSPLRKSDKLNFVFIHINKTAGTSIYKAVGLPGKQHLTVKEIIDKIGYSAWKQAYKFTSIRNPWDKVVSHYKHRIKTNQSKMAIQNISFKEWVSCTYGEPKDKFYYNNPKMFLPQTEWLKDNSGKIDIDMIIRFENIKEDFNEVAKVLGVRNKLGHLNRSIETDYRDYYDNETKEIINNWFLEDIIKFDYRFD